MYKYLFVLYSIFISFPLFSKTIDIPQQIRSAYSSNMYNAFVLQSQGKSNLAFIQFHSAREEAKKAGENPLKLIAVEQLFYWYRKYGSALNLFYQKPTGRDQIIDEFKSYAYHYKDNHSYSKYKSEWGKTPEQAAKTRNFMFGVAEFISGVFIVPVHPVLGPSIAVALWADGVNRMFTSLNDLWAEHEALIHLKNCEQTAAKAMNSE